MWRITAEFKPLGAFVTSDSVNTAQKSLMSNEQEYLELVKDCLADGEIGERARRMLECFRRKYNISEERAH